MKGLFDMPQNEMVSVSEKYKRVPLPKRKSLFLLSSLIIIMFLAQFPLIASAETVIESEPRAITKDVKPPTFTAGFEKGEIVVEYRADVNITEIKAINSRLNVRIKRKLPLKENVYLVAIPRGTKVLDAIADFGKIKEVVSAHPNYTYRKKRGTRAR